MLKKELCIKCWNNIPEWPWNKIDEEWWEERGIVGCPKEYREKGEMSDRKITEQPPSNCPFLLEYILNKEENKNA